MTDVVEVIVERVTTVEVITPGPQGPSGDGGNGGSLPDLDPSPAVTALRHPTETIDAKGRVTRATRNDNVATRNDIMVEHARIVQLDAVVNGMRTSGISGGLRT